MNYIESFHLNFLARHYGARKLAVTIGLLPESSLRETMPDGRIERDIAKRRNAISALLDQGYIKSMPDNEFQVTSKAFSEVEDEIISSRLSVGNDDQPLAVWLSAGLCQAGITAFVKGDRVLSRSGNKYYLIEESDTEQGVADFLQFSANFKSCFSKLLDLNQADTQNLQNVYTGIASISEDIEARRTSLSKKIRSMRRELYALENISEAKNIQYESNEMFSKAVRAWSRNQQQINMEENS